MPRNAFTTPYSRATLDANGNTLSDASGKSYTWDFENRLTQAIVPGTGTVAFKYDPFGRRIQKSGPLGTTNYLYDGGANLIEELDGSGNVLGRYIDEPGLFDRPLSMLRSDASSYYHADALGSITSLSNSAGALASTYTYDAFGKLTASTGALTNPFQYTGREFDAETGLYEYRMRYYDENAGRFVSEDPIGFWAGVNFYEYGEDSPVNYVDPMGLDTYSCKAPLRALGKAGPWLKDGLWPLPLYHEFLCVKDSSGNIVCGGLDRTGNPIWSPGKPSDDDMSHGQYEKRKTKNRCFDDCVRNAINDPKRPQFGIGPQATDCQEWSEDTLESCSKKCDVWRLYDK